MSHSQGSRVNVDSGSANTRERGVWGGMERSEEDVPVLYREIHVV